MAKIVQVGDDNFEAEVIRSGVPVLVDFWAEWCGPCRMIGPLVVEIAADNKGKVKVAKLNVDHSPNTPSKYGIRGIPTLMIFKNGKAHATKVGAVSKVELQRFVDENS